MKMADARPRLTFGMIVLNGEPFVRYNLRAVYPFAHQIIVVEGAAPAARGISTDDGHSTDGTLDALLDFKAREDPEGKLLIVTAEDEGHSTGFWPGEKHEQSRAYARRATGDYLWQVDVDEFYKPEDMAAILDMLEDDPGITAVSFKTTTFWGGFDYTTSGWYLQVGGDIFHRLFKWGPGYAYVTHRPPTVQDREGRDLRSLRWIDGTTMARKGVLLYHYALVFPQQVMDKCNYYSQVDWVRRERAYGWAAESFVRLKTPYRVHNVYDYPSWLDRFRDSHPPQIEAMRNDIVAGRLAITTRDSCDVERLLRSQSYALGRSCLRLAGAWRSRFLGLWSPCARRARKTLGLAARAVRRICYPKQRSLGGRL
jgi:hypothetical protein